MRRWGATGGRLVAALARGSQSGPAAPRAPGTPGVATGDAAETFHAGFSIGQVTAQMETLRNKLDDNKELLKSQMASLRESIRTNHEADVQMEGERQNALVGKLRENTRELKQSLDRMDSNVARTTDALKETHKHFHEAAQKHNDTRLENIKDTIRITAGILVALLVYIVLQLTHLAQVLTYNTQAMQQLRAAVENARDADERRAATSSGWFGRLFGSG